MKLSSSTSSGSASAVEHDPEATEYWWDRLPADLWLHDVATPVDQEHPFTVHAAAGIDHVLRSALGAGLCAAVGHRWLMSARHRRKDAERGLEFYKELALKGDSALSFPAPPHVEVSELELPVRKVRDALIRRRRLTFQSPFKPMHPELRTGYNRHHDNATAYAQHWYHADGPRPTLILAHGFLVSQRKYNARMFGLEWFYAQGYDIMLYTFPFHGRRKSSSDWFNGAGLISHGMAHFNEAMAHGVHDLRVFMDHLERSGAPSIGITGFSLGGYTAALMAGVDDRLAFCIPNSLPVSMPDLMYQWQPTRSIMKLYMRRTGMNMHQLRAGMAVNSPLTYAPKIDADRLMIVAGAGDRFATPRHAQTMHAHWPGSTLYWTPGNHLVHVRQGEYLREMKRFTDRCTGLG